MKTNDGVDINPDGSCPVCAREGLTPSYVYPGQEYGADSHYDPWWHFDADGLHLHLDFIPITGWRCNHGHALHGVPDCPVRGCAWNGSP